MEWMYKFEIEDDYVEDEYKEDNLAKGIVFLIDCGTFLFDKTTLDCENKDKPITWFEAIIKGCLSIVKNTAMTSDKDNVSIVLYRVRTGKNAIMKNVHVFLKLDQPQLEDVHKLMELQSISREQFDELYGFSNEYSFYHALWCCQSLFANKSKLGSKQILLFTYDDDPCNCREDAKSNLLVKIRDLKQNNINLEIIPIGSENCFDVNKFYKMILISDKGDSLDNCITIGNTVSKLDELMTRIRHKQHSKRVISRIPWFLGNDNLSISVSVYNLVRKAPPLTHVSLDRRTNTEVHKKRVKTLKENGQLLMPFDMKYGTKIHGKYICFEKEEIDKMRSILDIGVRLIGFKPLKYLKSYYQIRSSQFLYPDDLSIDGSTKLFAALLKRCCERELFALCVYVPRKSSRLQMVALVPQMEKLNENNNQTQPPGFSIIFLPFEDDIRKLYLPVSNEVSDEDKRMSEELIKSLSVEYEPESILNPALQKQLTIIEAIALNLEIPDKIEDNTVMINEEINEHCGNVLESYKNHFMLESEISAAKTSSKPIVDVDLEAYYKSGKLELLTIPQLKEEAKKLKIKIKGTKKMDIINSIYAHFDSIG